MKRKKLITFWGIVYLLCVICILFIRNHSFWPDLSLVEYVQLTSNFIPFRTIIKYIIDLLKNETSLKIVTTNLVGNLFLFFPVGLIFAYLWDGYSYKKRVYFLSLLALLGLELLQAILRVGFLDVDDILLNYAGFVVGIKLMKFKRQIPNA